MYPCTRQRTPFTRCVPQHVRGLPALAAVLAEPLLELPSVDHVLRPERVFRLDLAASNGGGGGAKKEDGCVCVECRKTLRRMIGSAKLAVMQQKTTAVIARKINASRPHRGLNLKHARCPRSPIQTRPPTKGWVTKVEKKLRGLNPKKWVTTTTTTPNHDQRRLGDNSDVAEKKPGGLSPKTWAMTTTTTPNHDQKRWVTQP